MSRSQPEPITVTVDGAHNVSGLFLAPSRARSLYVLAHGAGAGMSHPLMHAVAEHLAERQIATLRYQFPYMERGGKRPDPPGLAHATVRAAVRHAARLAPDVPLFAGGKSFGGRMTSQAQSTSPLPEVRGLIFLGFPLHPAKQPSDDRAKHLFDVHVPMLFLQGARDQLADAQLLSAVTQRLGERASLHFICNADHSLHVPASSGRSDADAMIETLDELAAWILSVISRIA